MKHNVFICIVDAGTILYPGFFGVTTYYGTTTFEYNFYFQSATLPRQREDFG